MALQDMQSSGLVSSVVSYLSGTTRKTAFATGNPNLAAEIREIPHNPQRVRKLTAEAAAEAVSRLDDPAAIEAVVAVDSRTAVHDAARARMYELSSQLRVTSNEKNVSDRTRRALAKEGRDAIKALEKCRSIDEAQVREWIGTLDEELLDEALASLVMTNRTSILDDFAKTCGQLMESTSSKTPALFEALRLNQYIAREVIASFDGTFDEDAASLIADVSHYWTPTKAGKVTDACAEIWRKANRTELLMWAGRIEPADVPSVFDEIDANSDLQLDHLVVATFRPDVADAVLATVVERGYLAASRSSKASYGFYEYDCLTHLLTVEGISPATATVLCGEFINPAVCEYIARKDAVPEAVAAAAKSHDAQDIFYAMRFENHRDHTEAFDEVARALYQYSTSLISFLCSRYSQWMKVQEIEARVVGYLAETLGENPDVWTSFWTLAQATTDASLDELAQAALALQS